MAFSLSQKKSDSQANSQKNSDFENRNYLNQQQIVLLKSLYMEKDCFLVSKGNQFFSVSCKIDEIFSEVIKSYVYIYNSRLQKSFSEDFLDSHELQIIVSLKGKDAEDIYKQSEQLHSSSDHDFLLNIDKLPHDSFDHEKNRNFYTEVTISAVHALIEKKTKKNFPKEIGYSFLDNLLLFRDNSFFLFTVGSVDISFPVPGFCESRKKRSSTFLHESIKICFPFFKKRDLDNDGCYFSSEFTNDWQTIDDSFFEKKIIIPNPQTIQHNGFERLVYSISKGWTTTEDKAVAVLIEDFEKRINEQQEYGYRSFFADRFLKLMTKKQLEPSAVLNNYLNGLALVNVFSFHDAKLELSNAFNDQAWRSRFPEIIRSVFPNSDYLNLLIDFWTIRSHLDIFNDVRVTDHLSYTVLVSGKDGKQQCYYLSRVCSFAEIYSLYENSCLRLGKSNVLKLFDFAFPSMNNIRLKLEDKILVYYFSRFLHQKNYTEDQLIEFKDHFNAWIDFLYRNPNLWDLASLRNDFVRFLENNDLSRFPQLVESKFLSAIIKKHEFTNLFFLIHRFLIGDHEKLEQFLKKSKEILQYQNLISKVLLESKVLSDFKYIQLLEKCFELEAVNSIETIFIDHSDRIKTIVNDHISVKLVSTRFWNFLLHNLSTEKSWKTFIDILKDEFLVEKLFDSIVPKLKSSQTKVYFLNHLYEKNLIKHLEYCLEKTSGLLDSEFLIWRDKNPKKYLFLILKSSSLRAREKNFLEIISKVPLVDIIKASDQTLHEFVSMLNDRFASAYFIQLIKSQDNHRDFLLQKLVEIPGFSQKLLINKKEIRKDLLESLKQEALPYFLIPFIISIYLIDVDESNFSKSNFGFLIYFLQKIDFRDSNSINAFSKFFQVYYLKILELKNSIIENNPEIYDSLTQKSLIFFENKFGYLPEEWIEETLKNRLHDLTVADCLNLLDNTIFDDLIRKFIEIKIDSDDLKFTDIELAQLRSLFGKHPHIIAKLIKKAEKLELKNIANSLYEDLYSSLTTDKKFDFFEKCLIKNPDFTFLVHWLKSYGEDRHIQGKLVEKFYTFLPLFYKSSDMALKQEFYRQVLRNKQLLKKFPIELFEFFSQTFEVEYDEFLTFWVENFYFLPLDLRIKFFMEKSFIKESRRLNFLELCFYHIKYSGFLTRSLNISKDKGLVEDLKFIINAIEKLAFSNEKNILFADEQFLEVFLEVIDDISNPMSEDFLISLHSRGLSKRSKELLNNITVKEIDHLSKEILGAIFYSFNNKTSGSLSDYEKFILEKLSFRLLEISTVEDFLNFFDKLSLEKIWRLDSRAQITLKALVLAICSKKPEFVDVVLHKIAPKQYLFSVEKINFKFFQVIEKELLNCKNEYEFLAISDSLFKIIKNFNHSKIIENTCLNILEMVFCSEFNFVNSEEVFLYLLSKMSSVEFCQSKGSVRVLISDSGLKRAADIFINYLIHNGKERVLFFDINLKSKMQNFHAALLERLCLQDPEKLIESYKNENFSNSCVILDDYISLKKPEILQKYQLKTLTDNVVLKIKNIISQESGIKNVAPLLLKKLSFLNDRNSLNAQDNIDEVYLCALVYLSSPEFHFDFFDNSPFPLAVELSKFAKKCQNIFSTEHNIRSLITFIRNMTPYFHLKKEDFLSTTKSSSSKDKKLEIQLNQKKTRILLELFSLANRTPESSTVEIFDILLEFIQIISLDKIDYDCIISDKEFSNHFFEFAITKIKLLPQDFKIKQIQDDLELSKYNQLAVSVKIFHELFIRLVEKEVPKSFKEWLMIPSIISKFFDIGCFRADTSLDYIFGLIYGSTEKLLDKINEDPITIKEFWQFIVTQYFVEITNLFDKISLREVQKLSISRLQNIIFIKAVELHQTNIDFFKNDHLWLFLHIPIRQLIILLRILTQNFHFLQENYELKMLYFRGLYSALLVIESKKELEGTLKDLLIGSISRVIKSYFSSMIQDSIGSSRMDLKKEQRRLLLRINNELIKNMTAENYILLIQDVKNLIKADLICDPKDLDVYRFLFNLASDKDKSYISKEVIELVRETKKSKKFETMEEFKIANSQF